VTGLIFMVVLTLIVIAAMRSSILEEKMAGNARSQNVAFQAAEAGLRAGERALNSPVDPASGPGYFSAPVAAATTTEYWKDYPDWDTAADPGLLYPGVEGVRYVIERIAALPGASGNDDLEYSAENTNPRNGIYRITARAEAGGNAPIILQSVVRIVLE
jgi:type IV pilus assembly protein PilX